MGNGERELGNGDDEVNHLPRNLHSEQFEVAEFIDDNNFLWFLTPVFFLVRSSGRRTAINFDETLYSAQIESAAFNGDNKIF